MVTIFEHPFVFPQSPSLPMFPCSRSPQSPPIQYARSVLPCSAHLSPCSTSLPVHVPSSRALPVLPAREESRFATRTARDMRSARPRVCVGVCIFTPSPSPVSHPPSCTLLPPYRLSRAAVPSYRRATALPLLPCHAAQPPPSRCRRFASLTTRVAVDSRPAVGRCCLGG